MLVDTRGLSNADSFKKIRDSISNFCIHDKKFTVIAESYEKSWFIKCFILSGCETELKETDLFYMVKCTPEICQ